MPRVDTCAECGFDYDLDEAMSSGAAIVEGAVALAALVDDDASEPHMRRDAQTWSPLEYGCHVRDVLLVQRERVLLARRRSRPSLEPMGREERVDQDGYREQNPEEIARQLGDAARLFANVLSRLGPADWERTVLYNYPEVSERSLRWVAVHTLHEVRHHLLDVRRQLV